MKDAGYKFLYNSSKDLIADLIADSEYHRRAYETVYAEALEYKRLLQECKDAKPC